MALPKFKIQYDLMLENNSEIFEALKKAKRGTAEFKESQRAALRIVRKNEDILCKRTENTKFTNFSTGLADKFMELVRANYPEIDFE
jgi:hypothetical protein